MQQLIAFALQLFSDKSLTKKAYLNVVAAGLDYSARFIVAFFVTPILVGGLGDLLYGIWIVIHRMTSHLSAAGGRSSQALKWFIVNRQNSRDEFDKRTGVGGAVAVWLFLIPLQITLGAIVVAFVPDWLGVAPKSHLVVQVTAAIMIAALILRGLVEVPRSVLEGQNLGYRRMWISVLLVVVGGFLAVLALRTGLGIIGVAAATLTTTILTGVAFLLVVRVYVPWFGIAKPDRKRIHQFLGLSWWFIAWHVVSRIMTATDVIILGVFASAEVVTTYALIRYLPEGLLRFLTVAVFQVIPGLGKIYGSGDLSRAAKVRGEIMLLTWLAATVIGATVLIWNNSFLQLWVGEQYQGNYVTTLLIVLMVMQYAWIAADADFINLTLDLKRKVSLGAVSAGTSVILAIVFVRWLDEDIVGLCLGMIFGRLFISIYYPMIIGKALTIPFLSQVTSMIRPGLFTVSLFSAVALFGSYLNVQSWMGLALAVVVTFIVVLLITFFAGMSFGQRSQIYSRILSVVKGRTH